jgi:hypothetical protein
MRLMSAVIASASILRTLFACSLLILSSCVWTEASLMPFFTLIR